jgi:hypothetical protein
MSIYSPKEIRETLGQFSGTISYHRFYQFFLTDGALCMAKMCEAHWLLDVIVSYQIRPEVAKEPFQVWKLTLDKSKNSGTITATDGNDKTLAKQRLMYTDFPLAEGITIWKADNVIFLPNEY